MTEPLYSDEAIIRSVTYSTKGGHKVSFEMDPEGWEAFKGMETQRCMMVLVPIQNDGQPDQDAALRAPTPADKPRRRWDELNATTQAGIRCADVDFQAWCGAVDAEETARVIRDRCGVKSRAEFATNRDAAALWWNIDDQFENRNIAE